MNLIDLPFLAELLLAALLVATLESPAAEEAANPPSREQPAAAGWSPERDHHAQRILRLERRSLPDSQPC